MDRTEKRGSALAHFTGVVILLLWGGVMVSFFVTGRIAHYLTSDAVFREQALVAGMMLIVLALFNALTFGSAGGDEDEDGHGPGGGHDGCCGEAAGHAGRHAHSHGESGGFSGGLAAVVILVAPLALAVWWSPDQFSETAIRNKLALSVGGGGGAARAGGGQGRNRGAASEAGTAGTAGAGEANADPGSEFGGFSREDLNEMVSRSAEGNYRIEVVELFYTAGDEEVQSVLKDVKVETVGQVIRDRRSRADGGQRLIVFRLFMECCAADARPLSVAVEFPDGVVPEFKDMGWYRIVGTMKYPKEGGVTVAAMVAESMVEVPTPRDRMAN